VLGLLVRRTGDPKQPLIEPLFEFSQGGKGAFIQPTPKTLFEVPALLPLCAVEFATAFFHVVYALAILSPGVEATVRLFFDTPSANSLRWFEYALTATTMSAFGAVNSGIFSFPYFVKVVFSGFALQACGYIIELLDSGSPRDWRIFDVVWWHIGTALNLSTIGIMLYQIFGSKTHGAFWLFVQNTVPFALWFNTFGLISRWLFHKWRQFSDPWFCERWYIILSLSTKVAVFWLAFAHVRVEPQPARDGARACDDAGAIAECKMVPVFVLELIVAVDVERVVVRAERQAVHDDCSGFEAVEALGLRPVGICC
jgi:hypothetical protein